MRKWLLLFLPLLFIDTPYFIIHNNKAYYPLFVTYLESDYGGDSNLLMDYNDEISLKLIKGAIWLKSPLGGLSIDTSLQKAISPPSYKHWLGTLPTGQDTLSYAIHALFINIYTAIVLTAISYITGCFFGMLQANSNSTNSLLIQVFTEICRSIPLVMIVILCIKKSILVFLLLFALTQWTKYAYLARIHTSSLMKKPYILDAKSQNVSMTWLLWHHFYPHIYSQTSSLLPHTFLNYFSIITSLNYFDITLLPNHPSLGKLIYYAKIHPASLWILLSCFFMFSILGILLISTNELSKS